MVYWLKKYCFKEAYLLYSYILHVGFIFLDLMPSFIRSFIFRFSFGKYGKNIMIDYKTFFRYMRKIQIGNNVSINRGCEFFTSANLDVSIIIGDNVVFSPNVKMYGAGHDYRYLDLPDTAGDINIKNNVWICANSIVLQGVTIGEYSVIYPNSVVTKDVPPYSIVAGSPATIIKKRKIYEH